MKHSLQGCTAQYTNMNECLNKEKERINRKEKELRDKVLGLNKELEQPETPVPVIQKEVIKETVKKEEKPIVQEYM